MVNKKAVGTDYVPAHIPQEKRQYNKQKVKTTSKQKFWLVKASPGVAVIALIFVICFSLVAQHVWINFLGYQVSQLNQGISDIQETNEKLKLQIASLGSLDRIENIATSELGMVNPDDVQYIFPDNMPHEQQDLVQIAGVNSPEVTTTAQLTQSTEAVEKAWLGTVQDFFFNYLMEESKS